MATQLRDTEFGHIIRMLTGHKVLRYPDEIDLGGCQTALGGSIGDEKPVPPLQDRTTGSRQEDDELEDGGREAFLVDWYGPDDPEVRRNAVAIIDEKARLTSLDQNPQNWSSNWKLFVTFQICLMNFAFYIASSIYVPGEQSLMDDFDVGQTVVTLGLSLFTMHATSPFTPPLHVPDTRLTGLPNTSGYALGPMLWSPLSDLPRLGRARLYLYTFLSFTLLQLPSGYAPNLPTFLTFRFLAGFVGSPALATGGATIADMYSPASVAYGFCIWGSFGICGPVFGPILGGFAAQARGWRLTVWIVCWMGAAVVVLLFFCMPESSAATILYRRAKRLRKATGNVKLRSQSEIEAAAGRAVASSQLAVLGSAFVLTFSEPIVFVMDLYTALLYGILFLWFESFPSSSAGSTISTSDSRGSSSWESSSEASSRSRCSSSGSNTASYPASPDQTSGPRWCSRRRILAPPRCRSVYSSTAGRRGRACTGSSRSSGRASSPSASSRCSTPC